MSTWGWWGFELPNRECKGTYQLYDYDSVPVININPKYKHITDIKKLVDFLGENSDCNDPLLISPTACYFDIKLDTMPTIFYIDQQGCILWGLEDDGTVVTSEGLVVAKTLPEFLTRIAIENSIWIKSYHTKESLNSDEIEYTKLLAKVTPNMFDASFASFSV